MIIEHLYTAKGGQGCSVVAVLAALALDDDRRVLLVDAAPSADLATIAGSVDRVEGCIPVIADIQTVTPMIDLVRMVEPDPAVLYGRGYDVVIVDHGLGAEPRPWPAPDLVNRNFKWREAAGRWTLVTRSCYLALQHAVAQPAQPDQIVVVTEADRSLRLSDVKAAVGAPVVATVDVSTAIARAVDAGLLTTRHMGAATRGLAGLVNAEVSR